jgi:hypothetical protein
VRSLLLADCSVPKKPVLRQLDDTSAVTPGRSGRSEEFSFNEKSLCKEINMELAKPCQNYDKAFDCLKFGKVLRIHVDTKDLSLRLPVHNVDSTLQSIATAIDSDSINLKKILTKPHGQAEPCFTQCVPS